MFQSGGIHTVVRHWQPEVIISFYDPKTCRKHSEFMHVQHQSSSMQHDVTYIAAYYTGSRCALSLMTCPLR
jgi:hypothetical protein